MISFNNLGWMGFLGNQMFQYATLKGIATRKGYWYSVSGGNELTDCFKIPETLPNQNINVIHVDKFEFDEEFFETCPDDVDIMGYFQSEKYFKHIEHELRKDFTFYDRIENICSHYRKHVFPNTELISLHVRRGDYVNHPSFVNLSLDYYNEALSLLPNLPILVISNDPTWCKQHFTSDQFTISLSNNSNIDMCLMSKCQYHVIANSTFSWWGSWLANSKKTIAPKQWFAGDNSDWNTSDLYLPEWTLI